MAIGANWKDVWKPVWKSVWATSFPAPAPSPSPAPAPAPVPTPAPPAVTISGATAATIPIRSQTLTRDQVAAAVGNNPRAIKLFENLLQDITGTIPDAIIESELQSRFSLQGADGSKNDSRNAIQLAHELEVALKIARTHAASIQALRSEVADLTVQVQQLSRIAQSALSTLRRDVDDVRAIAQGI